MITLKKLDDTNHNCMLSIAQTSDDGRASWEVQLTTTDLPPAFENSERRRVDLSIVSIHDLHEEGNNVFFIPVTLSAIVHGEGVQKLYYRQKYENNGVIAPTLMLNAMLSGNDLQIIEEPFLRLEFSVLPAQTDQRVPGTEGQRMGGQSTLVGAGLDLRDREHIDRGENANGGLDLAKGEHLQPNQQESVTT